MRTHTHIHREYCQVLHIVSELEVLGIPTDLQAYLSYNKAVFIKGILKSHSHQPKVVDHPASVSTHCGEQGENTLHLTHMLQRGEGEGKRVGLRTSCVTYTHAACVFWYIQYVRTYKLHVRIHTYVRIGCLVISCCSQLLGATHGVKAI